MGSLYQPSVEATDSNPRFGSPKQCSQADHPPAPIDQAYVYPSVGPGQAISAPGQAISAPCLEQAKFGLPRGYVLNSTTRNNYNAAQPILSTSDSTSLPMQTAAASYGSPIKNLSHYYVPIHSANGTYLKTIANR